jgi:hypothetical protein
VNMIDVLCSEIALKDPLHLDEVSTSDVNLS